MHWLNYQYLWIGNQGNNPSNMNPEYPKFTIIMFMCVLLVIKVKVIVLSKIDENRCKQTLASLP